MHLPVASVQALVLSAQADELESFAAAKAKQVDLFDGLLLLRIRCLGLHERRGDARGYFSEPRTNPSRSHGGDGVEILLLTNRPVFVFVGPGISLTGAYHMFRAAELLFCNSSGYQALAPVMYDHQEGCAPGARVPAVRQRAGGWQHQGGQTGRWAGARRPRVVMHALGFACLLACGAVRQRAARAAMPGMHWDLPACLAACMHSCMYGDSEVYCVAVRGGARRRAAATGRAQRAAAG